MNSDAIDVVVDLVGRNVRNQTQIFVNIINMLKFDVKCGECGANMTLKKGEHGKYYGCSQYPQCKATHSAKRDGAPLGIPASIRVRELRKEAHEQAARIWGPWNSAHCRKKEMYDWMHENTKSHHFARMGEEEILDTIKKMEMHEVQGRAEMLGEKASMRGLIVSLRLDSWWDLTLGDYLKWLWVEKIKRKK